MNADERPRERIERYLPALMLVVDASIIQAALPVRQCGRELGHPERSEGSLVAVLRSATSEGVNMLQVRDKRPHASTLPLADSALDAINHDQSRALVWINDGYAVAMTVETFALHLAEGRPMPPEDQRRLVAVSRSVHSPEAATRAEAEGADMLVLGTVFPSPSHPNGPTIGLDGVREVCARVQIPVVGIGGITAQNAADVIRAGASGVAVISAIFDAPGPRAAAAALRTVIDAAWRERHPDPSTQSASPAVQE